ncbi:TlpA family protein disulfide reductase [Flavobacteriaceae bacterium AU392]|nr:TlpA family protein disulfide reductase [Flavobacteriaceae bacterium]RKM86063.1 TlpA family protein disulfide reductase [Flavobacteriaceae bacterium AU392]
MKKKLIILILFTTSFSCAKKQKLELLPGKYRAVIEVQDNEELPFIFEVVSKNKLKIFNAEEVIEVDEIEYFKDSVKIQTPVFEGFIVAKFEGNNLKGQFIKENEDKITSFKAEYNNSARFNITSKPLVDVSGIWETIFSEGIEGDEYIAKGIFKQEENKVTGTFRTQTGDYRYLEGVVDGDELRLSTFDGAHAFLFTAKITDSTLQGVFYSGNHWKEPFVAKRNNDYDLPNGDHLTYLKEGYDKLAFSFPDANGNNISLEDERFKNKVVVIQIMGSWCPNCLDESRYYTQFYNNHKDEDVEFIALAFEYAKTKESAFRSIKRLRDKIGINYPIVLAQFGTDDKTLAQEKLPMLNHILSYPTTVFVDKKGNVRKIHTGFDGPATGDKYITFKKEFETFVSELIDE